MTLPVATLATAQQRAMTASLIYRPGHVTAQRRDAYAVAVSPHRQRIVAAAYRSLPSVATDDRTREAFRAFREETLRQLDAIMSAGISVSVSETDPYAGPAELFADIAEHGRIAVLSTRATGGHAFLSDDDNDAFRAVHDVLGHTFTGRGFDRHGEDAAYRAHSHLYSPTARAALATETRGQNAALITSADGATFAEQKIALLPDAFHVPAYLVPSADEHSAALAQARRFHTDAGLPATF